MQIFLKNIKHFQSILYYLIKNTSHGTNLIVKCCIDQIFWKRLYIVYAEKGYFIWTWNMK